ncbi:hypothetical protein [Desulfocicer niacini]
MIYNKKPQQPRQTLQQKELGQTPEQEQQARFEQKTMYTNNPYYGSDVVPQSQQQPTQTPIDNSAPPQPPAHVMSDPFPPPLQRSFLSDWWSMTKRLDPDRYNRTFKLFGKLNRSNLVGELPERIGQMSRVR